MQNFKIDHILNITSNEQDSINELITLDCLKVGLNVIANQVNIIEKPFRGRKISFFGFGLDLPPGAEQLIPCYFHWFGTSLCNYVRLIGFLSGIHNNVYVRSDTENSNNYDLIKKHCDNYLKSIPELEPVLTWRNKVFAHFALTDPRKSDNAALLDVSTMSPISLINGRFCVGGMIISTRGAEIEMPTWSLTEVYEKLSSRYWPEYSLRNF